VGLLREQRLGTFETPGGPQRGQYYHRRILAAIETRNAEQARSEMRAHLQQVRDDSRLPSGAEERVVSRPAS
jgi:DNA-binding FadR family transcriptional regulator